MDEHTALRELAGDIRRTLATDRAAAVAGLEELQSRLGSHARREERGVFAALKAQGEYVAEIVELEQEHTGFDRSLGILDPSASDFDELVRAMLAELSEHIDKEDLGIFPVAVVTLGADGWDIVTRAHEEHSSPRP